MPPKPRVLTEQELVQVEKLAGILTSEQIADFLGIARTTFYDVMKRQPDVSERYKKGRANVIGNVGKNLIQKALEGDNAAMMFYLKTQAGWKETQNVNHTSDDGSMSPGVSNEAVLEALKRKHANDDT